MKRIYLLLIMIVIIILGFVFGSKQKRIVESDDMELIRAYIKCYNDKTWDDFVNLHAPKDRNSWRDFLGDEENIENHVGLFGVKRMDLIECIKLDWEWAMTETSVRYFYPDRDAIDARAYALKTECEKYVETPFFKEGANYFVLVLIEEDGKWYTGELIGADEPLWERMKRENNK